MKIMRLITLFLAIGSPLFAQTVDTLSGNKVVFLGDSITQTGTYISFLEYYLDKLYPRKNFDFYAIGLASETVSGLSEEGHARGEFPRPCLFERLGRALERIKPEVVFACYGINDGIYKPFDDERFAAFTNGVLMMVEQCKAAGVQQIFLLTPPIYDYDKPRRENDFNYDEVMIRYAAWETSLKIPGVFIVDLHTAMRKARSGRNECFSKDRIHPNDDGHLVMAKTILKAFGVNVPDESAEIIRTDPLFIQIDERRIHRGTAWRHGIGFTREKQVEPQPVEDKEVEAVKMQGKIDAMRRGEQ